jgi:DHA3 family multidrug efflux protein-like MFS transporter
VISGLLVAFDGMRSTILLAMVVSAASFVHLAGVRIEERRVVTTASADGGHGVDLKGTSAWCGACPGCSP